MSVGLDVDYGVGPLDGDVLSAGRLTWAPGRPPNRPDMPGRRLLTFTVAGKGVYRCNDVQLSTERGDLVVMFDDSPTTHEVPAGDEPWEYFHLLFNPPVRSSLPPAFERIAPGLYLAHVALESTRQRLQDAFARVIAEISRRDTSEALRDLGDGSPMLVSESTGEPQRRLLVTMVEEILLLAIQDLTGEETFDPRISAALEVMGADPVGPHTVRSLAEQMNMSQSRFAHLFTSDVGSSPMRTLRVIRLQHAARLLQCTHLSIGAVARASGFSSIYDFSRQFRRHRGMSPTRYRNQWRA